MLSAHVAASRRRLERSGLALHVLWTRFAAAQGHRMNAAQLRLFNPDPEPVSPFRDRWQVREALTPDERPAGKLLQALTMRGLDPDAREAAAALILELDRAAHERRTEERGVTRMCGCGCGVALPGRRANMRYVDARHRDRAYRQRRTVPTTPFWRAVAQLRRRRLWPSERPGVTGHPRKPSSDGRTASEGPQTRPLRLAT